MTLALTFEELVRYTNGERDKWRAWFVEHPGAVEAPGQPGAPFATLRKQVGNKI
jgi:hypothetical protein